MRRIHIFKSGLQTDSRGVALSFTAADLARTASAYSPALHEAPIVIGHPEEDHPAFGWVKAITAEGDNLYAESHQVNPDFAEMVRGGAFKKVSVSLYTPTHPQNPAPGAYYVRHVGYLGAMAPAVKGLAPTEFAAADADCIELQLDFSEATPGAAAAVAPEPLSLPPETEAANSGTGASPQGLPPAAASGTPSTPETTTVTLEEAAALKAANDQLTADLAASQDALRAQATAAKSAEHTAFAEALVAQTRCTAADAPVIVAALSFMDPATAPGDKPNVLSFGEGDTKTPLATAFKAFLNTLPKKVEFGEQASHSRAAGEEGKTPGVTYAEGTTQEQIAMDQRIRSHAKANKLSYAEAAQAVAVVR